MLSKHEKLLSPDQEFARLDARIIRCKKCPRLVEFRELVSKQKRKQFASERYWGKPVPGYGDPDARVIVVGLAPAAHGGNRTGRVFTGDSSARFLVKHLYRAGFASRETSERKDDGLEYDDAYITAVVKCVPPGDKPTMKEKRNCAPYFESEVSLLGNAKAILALGRFAFDSIVSLAKESYGAEGTFHFKHGEKYFLSDTFPIVFASYHPSPRNTNTGKLTDAMFDSLLDDVKASINAPR